MTEFHLTTPTLDSEWRAIILFGRNVASYKFALARSLIEKIDQGKTNIELNELAEPYSRFICNHLKKEEKQGTFKSSQFLGACKNYNDGKINKESLLDFTVRFGFNNVIDAFHIVNQKEIPSRFFVDERKNRRSITLTDNAFDLRATFQGGSLDQEIEARWRLVETAWSLGLSRSLLPIQVSNEDGELFFNAKRRIPITSSRAALNGYQKGRCFYCFSEISAASGHPDLADVDHFFPWILKQKSGCGDIDGVWNLVLACRECNRGEGGKMARVPSQKLLERLHRRNTYLIESHHPLRETLIMQTGTQQEDRRRFLQQRHNQATKALIHQWEPQANSTAAF